MQKKILIICNGGIAKTPDGKLWGNGTTGDFLVNLQKEGYGVTYASHQGDKEKSKFLYNFDLTGNKIKSVILHGRRPKSYFSIIRLFLLILYHKNIYIFYPARHSKRAAKFCRLLGMKYGVYVRGYGSYKKYGNNKSENKEELNDSFILSNAKFLITVSPKLKKDLEIFNNRVSIFPEKIWTLMRIYSNLYFLKGVSWQLMSTLTIRLLKV